MSSHHRRRFVERGRPSGVRGISIWTHPIPRARRCAAATFSPWGSTATIDPHAPCVYVATARDFGRHNTTITPTAVSLPGRLDPCNDKVRKYRPTERECIRRPFRAGSFIAHVNCRLMDFSGYQMRRVNKWQKWPVDFCFYLMIAERGVALKRATEGDDAQKKEKKGAKVDNDRFYCDFW